MKNLKTLIIKVVILSFFVLCLLTTLVCAQDSNELQLYNRNEKVQLSKALIHKNDDYYISVDDLAKINIQYKFTEQNDGLRLDDLKLHCHDIMGKRYYYDLRIAFKPNCKDKLKIGNIHRGE